MAELVYGFIWVVFVRLESGSTRLSVNFPHALGSLWHPTGKQVQERIASAPRHLFPSRSPDCAGHYEVF